MFNTKTFNDFIITNNVIRLFENPLTLKSGRLSHLYVNWRHISNDVLLCEQTAQFIIDFCNLKSIDVNCFFGVPEGATKLGILTQYLWVKQQQSPTTHLSMGRAKPKDHGSPSDRYFIGEPNGNIVVIEDVITTGQSLFNTIDQLQTLKKNIVACISLTNREPKETPESVHEQLSQRNIPYYTLSYANNLLKELSKTLSSNQKKLVTKELNLLR